jgi:L-cysteine desulfidase
MLPKVSLTLEVAIRVAANIRARLAGVTRPAEKQSYAGNQSLATD